MYIIMKSDELIHYGVKGMRWGVRRDNRKYANRHLKAAAASRRDARDLRAHGYIEESKAVMRVANKQQKKGERKIAKKVAKIEKKRNKALSVRSSAKYTYKQRKYLTDDELRGRINRINMERQLRDLSKTRRGDYGDASLAPLMKSGRQAATKAVGTYGAKMIVAETLGPEAAAFIKPKK